MAKVHKFIPGDTEVTYGFMPDDTATKTKMGRLAVVAYLVHEVFDYPHIPVYLKSRLYGLYINILAVIIPK